MTFVLSSLFVIRIDVVEVWQVPEGKSLVGDDDRKLSKGCRTPIPKSS